MRCTLAARGSQALFKYAAAIPDGSSFLVTLTGQQKSKLNLNQIQTLKSAATTYQTQQSFSAIKYHTTHNGTLAPDARCPLRHHAVGAGYVSLAKSACRRY